MDNIFWMPIPKEYAVSFLNMLDLAQSIFEPETESDEKCKQLIIEFIAKKKPFYIKCETCKGSGKLDGLRCINCNGEGFTDGAKRRFISPRLSKEV